MNVYPHHWVKAGQVVPVRVLEDRGDMLLVRSPDPYDFGEIEYEVDKDLVIKNV